ncbi:hypothetical protein SGRA_3400 [Saprospira grandis str. Lewin]|uniref:Uncharacterized protein n=1 Tax=Saprospira grandis (strain Lewin) TaxID=984262 RepID=H6L1P7_SAPGL|nr:hypothetical protein SGRA_3400 [Saprospira grandis str. Lewin]
MPQNATNAKATNVDRFIYYFLVYFFFFLGASAAASPCGATLQGSQACSALRPNGLGLRLRRPLSHR